MEQLLIDQKLKQSLLGRKISSMNKRMYKLELICVKYIPILIALITLIDVILYYFDINFELINYVAGTSFLTMIPMYISSYVYKFCEYHRMFLHYIVVNKVVMMIDLYIGIPLGDFMLLVLYLIVAGIFAFLALYLHQKYGGRKND